MLKGEVSIVDPVMFDELNESKIMSAALLTKREAGQSGMYSENWRKMLVSKNYGVTLKSYAKLRFCDLRSAGDRPEAKHPRPTRAWSGGYGLEYLSHLFDFSQKYLCVASSLKIGSLGSFWMVVMIN